MNNYIYILIYGDYTISNLNHDDLYKHKMVEFIFKDKNKRKNFLHCLTYNKHYVFSIYDIPKFWSFKEIKSKSIHIDEKQKHIILSEDNLIFLIKELNLFYNKIIAYKTKNNIDSIDNKSGLNDILNDLQQLKTIFKIISGFHYFKKEKLISSDYHLGKLRDDINLLNNQKSIKYQTISINDHSIKKLINSYLHIKFNKDYFYILKSDKTKKEYKNIIMILDKIDQITNFYKDNTINHREFIFKNKRHFNENYSTLIKQLEKLINNQQIRCQNRRKYFSLNMDAIFEDIVSKYYLNHYDIKLEKKLAIKYLVDLNKDSRPDFIFDDTVIDAKYKNFNIEEISDNDINKLIRDLVVHDKKNGILIFVSDYKPFTYEYETEKEIVTKLTANSTSEIIFKTIPFKLDK